MSIDTLDYINDTRYDMSMKTNAINLLRPYPPATSKRVYLNSSKGA